MRFTLLCNMKALCIYLVIILLSSQSIDAQIPNLLKEQVVSNVKSIYRHKYSAKEKNGKLKITRSTRESVNLEIDSSHLLVHFLGWYPKAKKYERVEEFHNIFQFDSLGRIVSKVKVDHYKPPYLNEDTQRVKSSYGFNFKLDSLFDNGRFINVHWTFKDESGKTQKFVNFNSEGKVIEKHEYGYDASGNMILDTTYTENDSMCCIRRFVYDRRGNEVFIVVYYPNGDFFDYENFEYEYDERGNWVKRKIYYRGKLQYLVTREFEYRN